MLWEQVLCWSIFSVPCNALALGLHFNNLLELPLLAA